MIFSETNCIAFSKHDGTREEETCFGSVDFTLLKSSFSKLCFYAFGPSMNAAGFDV